MVAEEKKLVRVQAPLSSVDRQPLMRDTGDALDERAASESGGSSGDHVASLRRVDVIRSFADEDQLPGLERGRHAVAANAEQPERSGGSKIR